MSEYHGIYVERDQQNSKIFVSFVFSVVVFDKMSKDI